MVRQHHIRDLEIPGSRFARPGMTPSSFLLLAAILARRVTRVALGLLVRLERGLPLSFLFLLARDADGFCRLRFVLEALGFGLRGLARKLCLLAIGRDRLAL